MRGYRTFPLIRFHYERFHYDSSTMNSSTKEQFHYSRFTIVNTKHLTDIPMTK